MVTKIQCHVSGISIPSCVVCYSFLRACRSGAGGLGGKIQAFAQDVEISLPGR